MQNQHCFSLGSPFPRVSSVVFLSSLFCLFPSLFLISLVLPSMLFVISKGVLSIQSVIQQDSPIPLYRSWTYPINYSIIIFACLKYHAIIHWNLYTAFQGSTISAIYIDTRDRGKCYTSAQLIKLFFITILYNIPEYLWSAETKFNHKISQKSL